MNQRLTKAKRLLKLQEQLHEIEKWKLAGLRKKRGELREAQASLIQTLNDDEALYGLFVDARARRLQQLASQEAHNKQLEEQQSEVALDRAKKVKRIERAVSRLKVDDRRAVEKADYMQLLDILTSKPKASLP